MGAGHAPILAALVVVANCSAEVDRGAQVQVLKQLCGCASKGSAHIDRSVTPSASASKLTRMLSSRTAQAEKSAKSALIAIQHISPDSRQQCVQILLDEGCSIDARCHPTPQVSTLTNCILLIVCCGRKKKDPCGFVHTCLLHGRSRIPHLPVFTISASLQCHRCQCGSVMLPLVPCFVQGPGRLHTPHAGCKITVRACREASS